MSGRLSIRFVDFAVFSFEFDRVRCGSFTPFLVRKWCGCPVRGSEDGPSRWPVLTTYVAYEFLRVAGGWILQALESVGLLHGNSIHPPLAVQFAFGYDAKPRVP
jgi:hypothetical protein